ncbi:MAG: FlgD immunoglobulin-like domain containing protein [Thermoleophilia bacterium]
MLALFIAALGVFVLPFAFPTPPPIITRFQATRLFSPNGDHHRDTARISVHMRVPGTISLDVASGNTVVRRLVTDRAVPRGWVRAAWEGRDDAGKPVPDGRYSIRVNARASNDRRFRSSRRIIIDTQGPGLALAEVRSAGPSRLRAPAQCEATIVTDGDGRVGIDRTARPAGGAVVQHIGSRPARNNAEIHIDWNGRTAGQPVAPGLVGLRLWASDAVGNTVTQQRTCWVGNLTGVLRPALPSRGARISVALRDADGHPLPAGERVTLRLYRRISGPGRGERVLGARVARAVATTAGAAAMRLPPRIAPRAMWLVVDAAGGRALIDLAGTS